MVNSIHYHAGFTLAFCGQKIPLNLWVDLLAPLVYNGSIVHERLDRMAYKFKNFRALHLQLVLFHYNNPWVAQQDLASRFGLTGPWVSQILNSDEGREILERLRNQSLDTALDVAAQLQAIAPLALSERIDLAMNKATPPSVREKALSGLLEMAGHSPVKRVQLQKQPEENDLVGKSDSELRAELLGIVGEGRGPDGKPLN